MVARNIVYCDRCGALMKEKKVVKTDKEYDLCEACYNRITTWLNSSEKQPAGMFG